MKTGTGGILPPNLSCPADVLDNFNAHKVAQCASLGQNEPAEQPHQLALVTVADLAEMSHLRPDLILALATIGLPKNPEQVTREDRTFALLARAVIQSLDSYHVRGTDGTFGIIGSCFYMNCDSDAVENMFRRLQDYLGVSHAAIDDPGWIPFMPPEDKVTAPSSPVDPLPTEPCDHANPMVLALQ